MYFMSLKHFATECVAIIQIHKVIYIMLFQPIVDSIIQ